MFPCQSGPGQQEVPQRCNPHRFAEPPGRGHKGLAAPAVGWRGSALVPPLRGLLTTGRLGVAPMSERSGSTGGPATMQPPPLRGAPCEGAQGSGRPYGGMARPRPRAPSQGAADHREAGGCSHVRAVRVNGMSHNDTTPTASRSPLGGGTRVWPPYGTRWGERGYIHYLLSIVHPKQKKPPRRAVSFAWKIRISCRTASGWWRLLLSLQCPWGRWWWRCGH